VLEDHCWKEDQFTVLPGQGIKNREARVAECWFCEFGDDGNDTSCERQFNLDHRKCEDYRGTSFYNKDFTLVIKRWLNRVEEDTSGLTFQEWTPDVDTSRSPVAFLINSRELRSAGFNLNSGKCFLQHLRQLLA
jgi:hypothetical protein